PWSRVGDRVLDELDRPAGARDLCGAHRGHEDVPIGLLWCFGWCSGLAGLLLFRPGNGHLPDVCPRRRVTRDLRESKPAGFHGPPFENSKCGPTVTNHDPYSLPFSGTVVTSVSRECSITVNRQVLVPVWWCGESFWPGSKVTSTAVALAVFPSSFSMMSRWESWVTFTALSWSWSSANVTATPTPMPAASVNRVRIMIISLTALAPSCW